MIEIAEEFIEAVHRGQVLVAVALMILPELTGAVAKALHDGSHGDVSLLPTFRCAGDADLGHAGADWAGAVNERSTPGSATLLSIVVRKEHTFLGNSVDVGCLVTHHATVVVADVFRADVISPDDKDVGFLCGLGLSRRYHCHGNHQRGRQQKDLGK